VQRQGWSGDLGLVEEGQGGVAGLLSDAQAVEHYEISRYGTLIAWAEELGLFEAVTLDEEKARTRT